jgi:hypothetical protein
MPGLREPHGRGARHPQRFAPAAPLLARPSCTQVNGEQRTVLLEASQGESLVIEAVGAAAEAGGQAAVRARVGKVAWPLLPGAHTSRSSTDAGVPTFIFSSVDADTPELITCVAMPQGRRGRGRIPRVLRRRTADIAGSGTTAAAAGAHARMVIGPFPCSNQRLPRPLLANAAAAADLDRLAELLGRLTKFHATRPKGPALQLPGIKGEQVRGTGIGMKTDQQAADGGSNNGRRPLNPAYNYEPASNACPHALVGAQH